MTKNVAEKGIIFLITNLYQSNTTKPTERNKAEPNNTCDRRTFPTFYLQAKLSPLEIALAEIKLPKINRRGVGIRTSWVENFCKAN